MSTSSLQSRIVVGLDIGTTFTKVVLAYPDKTMVPLRDSESGRDSIPIPTAVYRRKKGDGTFEYSFGHAAELDGLLDPENLATGFKRHMGSPDKRYFEGTASAQDVWTIWAGYLLESAQRQAGERVTAAAMTFPQHWPDLAKAQAIAATQAAGWAIFEPGLGGQGTGTEPMMAAVAVGNARQLADSGATLMVADVGGGTTDVTLARFAGGELQVLGAAGDDKLGGLDLRGRLAAVVLDMARKEKLVSAKDAQRLLDTPDLKLAFLNQIAEALPMLSRRDQHRFSITFGTKPGLITVTRKDYESTVLAPFVAKVLACVDKAKAQAADKLSPGQPVSLVLVGGPCSDPFIAGSIVKHTGYTRLHEADPTTAVATGAALHAAWLQQIRQAKVLSLPGQIRPRERSPFDIGVMVSDGPQATPHSCVLIPKGTLSHEAVTQHFGMNHPTDLTATFVQCEGEGQPIEACHPLGQIQWSGLPVESVRTARLKIVAYFDDAGMFNAELTDTVSGRTESIRVSVTHQAAA